MGMMTVRNIPDAVQNALKARARRHHRSVQAEVRAILEEAVMPETRLHVGDALAALGRRIGLTNEDFEVLDRLRDKTPVEPMRLEWSSWIPMSYPRR